MKMNKILLSIVAASVFAASCNTSLTVQKKQHSNGYYVSLSKTEKKDQKTESVAVKNNSTVAAKEVASIQQQIASSVVSTAAAKSEVASQVEVTTNSAKADAVQQDVKSTFTNKVSQLKAAEKAMKLIKSPAKDVNSADDESILLIILAILLPPVAVGLATNWNGKDLLINILLCFFCFWLGGIIHAFVVLKREGVV